MPLRREKPKDKTKRAPSAEQRPTGGDRATMVRRAVLEAAAELFAERGYGGTTLRDVANVLGMSRPALYYHFESKEKILEAIVEELTLATERQLATIAKEDGADPEVALRLVMESTTQWLLNHQIFFRVLDRSEAELPPDVRASNEVSKKTILEYFVRIIERGIAVGKFRPIDPHVAALAISGMRNWAAWWFRPDGRLTIKETSELISDMAVRSLLRTDAHRSRSERVDDVLRILQEDIAHLSYVMKD